MRPPGKPNLQFPRQNNHTNADLHQHEAATKPLACRRQNIQQDKRIYAGGQFSSSNVTSFIYTAVAAASVVGTKATSERVDIFSEYAVG